MNLQIQRCINLRNNVINWLDYWLDKYKIKQSEPLTFYCKHHIVISVPHRLLHTFKEIFVQEDYTGYVDVDEQSALTVLDIGANVGYFSLYFLSKYPKSHVYAFEPIPQNFRLLEKHQQMNSSKSLTVINKAVCGKSGEISLNYNADDSFTTSASIFGASSEPNEIKVPCISLADIMTSLHLDRIDVIKMDCEGAEYEILYSCSKEVLAAISRIFLEAHKGMEKGQNRESLCSFLEGQGYTVRSKGDMVWAWRE